MKAKRAFITVTVANMANLNKFDFLGIVSKVAKCVRALSLAWFLYLSLTCKSVLNPGLVFLAKVSTKNSFGNISLQMKYAGISHYWQPLLQTRGCIPKSACIQPLLFEGRNMWLLGQHTSKQQPDNSLEIVLNAVQRLSCRMGVDLGTC